eukprot:3434705-Amphidinium_carterae.1
MQNAAHGGVKLKKGRWQRSHPSRGRGVPHGLIFHYDSGLSLAHQLRERIIARCPACLHWTKCLHRPPVLKTCSLLHLWKWVSTCINGVSVEH